MENTVNNLGYHSKTTLPHFQQCALACQDYNRLSFLLLGHRFIAIGQPVCLSFPWWEWGKRGYQMKLKEHFPYLIKNTHAWTENKPEPLPEDRKLSQEKKKKKNSTQIKVATSKSRLPITLFRVAPCRWDFQNRKSQDENWMFPRRKQKSIRGTRWMQPWSAGQGTSPESGAGAARCQTLFFLFLKIIPWSSKSREVQAGRQEEHSQGEEGLDSCWGRPSPASPPISELY